MNKRFLKTVFSVCFAGSFIFGSMFVSNGILIRKENSLLSDSGEMEVNSPVIAWNQEEFPAVARTGEDGAASTETVTDNFYNESDAADTGYTVTPEQMRSVLETWEGDSFEAIHDPVEGQLSMEEAILIGEKWIFLMADTNERLKEVFSGYVTNAGTGDEVNNSFVESSDAGIIVGPRAALSVKIGKGKNYEIVEPYYSCWDLQFYGKNVDVDMSLNAVTGQVWKAVINIYSDTENIVLKEESVYLFAELAGLDLTKADSYSVLGNEVCLYIADSPVYVEAVQDGTMISSVIEAYDGASADATEEYISFSYAVRTVE